MDGPGGGFGAFSVASALAVARGVSGLADALADALAALGARGISPPCADASDETARIAHTTAPRVRSPTTEKPIDLGPAYTVAAAVLGRIRRRCLWRVAAWYAVSRTR